MIFSITEFGIGKNSNTKVEKAFFLIIKPGLLMVQTKEKATKYFKIFLLQIVQYGY
jgi:hypothetical protein